MGLKQLLVVLAVFVVVESLNETQSQASECLLSISERVDCGYYGIKEGECNSRGCCWQPVQQNKQHDIPWCYYQKPPKQCTAVSEKVDCGYYGIKQKGCEDKGCCWHPLEENSQTPWCFYPENQGNSSYKVSNITKSESGIEGWLQSINGQFPTLGLDIKILKFRMEFESFERIHIKLIDAENERWEIPSQYVPRNAPITASKKPLYSLEYTESPFTITVKRSSTNETIFSTYGFPLIMKNQYLEWSTSIPSTANLYGLGERTSTYGIRLHRSNDPPMIYTLWNRDQSAHWTNQNLYGSHPFLMDLRAESGNTHGVFLMNSNGMDVVLMEQSVTYRAIGGVLDFYIFLGPTPENVMQQYTQLIGKPALPAYWALGFHQCKYGYKDIEQVEQVVQNYSLAQIPLETIWVDIDHMDKKKDFTLDPINYPVEKVKAFVDKLHKQNQKIVPILDPGILVEVGYDAYDDGIQDEIFIQQKDGSYYVGQVWPGPVHFPDFMNPKSFDYWRNQLARFKREMLDFDGIWIDMNEVSNFCTGETCTIPSGAAKQITQCYLYCSEPENGDLLQNPPYRIGNGGQQKLPIYTKTLSLDLVHYGGIMEYDVHNLYGLMEAQTTNAALQNITGLRPFVLSRSTFPGSGAVTAHWTGDIGSTWPDLQYSVSGVLNSNLFGIPFAGVDICGFLFYTTEELCQRWIQAAAFYPFARDHSDKTGGYQELYRWPKVAEAARNNLGLRYRLLPYLYTLFFRANEIGGTVMRPVFFEFADDPNTYNMIDQYMWGQIEQYLKRAYFPQGAWYSLWDYQRYDGPEKVTLDQDWLEYKTPVFLRGGGIIPMQQNESTTTASRQTPFTLLAAVKCLGNTVGIANGDLYWDEGEKINPQKWLYTKFKLSNNYLQGGIFVTDIFQGPQKIHCNCIPRLQKIVILGVKYDIYLVYVNGVKVGRGDFEYDYDMEMLVVKNQKIDLTTKWQVTWYSRSPALNFAEI